MTLQKNLDLEIRSDMTMGRLQISKTQLQICPFLTKRKQYCRAGNNQQQRNPTRNRQTVCTLVLNHVGWVKLRQQRQENIRTIQRQVSSLQHNILSQHPLATHNQHPLYHVQHATKTQEYNTWCFVLFPFLSFPDHPSC
jgi:hypothetical protein